MVLVKITTRGYNLIHENQEDECRALLRSLTEIAENKGEFMVESKEQFDGMNYSVVNTFASGDKGWLYDLAVLPSVAEGKGIINQRIPT